MNTTRFLGITDEVTTCGCCGRANLKRTIALSLDGDSEAVYFGSNCAERALGGRGYSVKGAEITRRAEKVDELKRRAAWLTDGLSRVESMLAAGHARYLIGGQPKGALLAELQTSYRRDLEQVSAALETESAIS